MDGRRALLLLLLSYYLYIIALFFSKTIYSYDSSKNATFCLQISSVEIFIIGAIAKAIATTATYPLQIVQSILRVKHI